MSFALLLPVSTKGRSDIRLGLRFLFFGYQPKEFHSLTALPNSLPDTAHLSPPVFLSQASAPGSSCRRREVGTVYHFSVSAVLLVTSWQPSRGGGSRLSRLLSAAFPTAFEVLSLTLLHSTVILLSHSGCRHLYPDFISLRDQVVPALLLLFFFLL